jgi:hypothetical protein
VGKLHPPVRNIWDLDDEKSCFPEEITQAAQVLDRKFEMLEDMEEGDQVEGTGPFWELQKGAVGHIQPEVGFGVLRVANVRLDPFRLVPKGFHQKDKFPAAGACVQGRQRWSVGGEVLPDPLVTVAGAAGGPENMPVLRGEGPFVLLAVLFFVKLGNIGDRDGIDPDKPALDPTHIPQFGAVAVPERDDRRLMASGERAGALGGDCLFGA